MCGQNLVGTGRDGIIVNNIVKLSRYTTRKRALKSHRLSETPIVWRHTSDTFTPRGLGYNRASCEL